MTMLPISDGLAERIRSLAAQRGTDVEQLLAQWAEAAVEAAEDAEDIAAIEARRDEPTITHAELIARWGLS